MHGEGAVLNSSRPTDFDRVWLKLQAVIKYVLSNYPLGAGANFSKTSARLYTA